MNINPENLKQAYIEAYKEESIEGLYIRYTQIKPLLEDLAASFNVNEIGKSFEGREAYSVQIGTGSKKVLIWSQMHGNESTGTKAVFDFLNFFKNPKTFEKERDIILENCTIIFIPMLNPDGAEVYTRVNKQNIDLNRDAVDLKGTESKILRSVLDEFNPDFCFNLHDQRTIFNVEGTENPATISFLAPSIDKERSINEGRKETMSVIVAMNTYLQKIIPNHIGRYTDEFYPTATGDNFQKLGHNTILIEAGHFPGDYKREKTREYNFYSLLIGCLNISKSKKTDDYEKYFLIPNNDNRFVDVIYENVKLSTKNNEILKKIAVLFTYEIVNNKLIKNERIIENVNLELILAHNTVDMRGKAIF